MKQLAKITLLAIATLFALPSFAQLSAAQIDIFFSTVRPHPTDATKKRVVVVVQAGAGYVTDDAVYSNNAMNKNGSLTAMTIGFTATNITAAAMAVSYPSPAQYTGSTTPSFTPANPACLLGDGFTLNVQRNAGAPDISSTARTLFYIDFPASITPEPVFAVRSLPLSTTETTCAGRVSFWVNTHPDNLPGSGKLKMGLAATPLAVKLTSFDAQKAAENKAAITWTTANEQGVASYEVQRALDGKNFDAVIATQKSTGKAADQYKVMDNSTATGVNYYRLKMIGTDGEYSYSAVKTVSFGKDRSFALSPNPAGDFVMIQGTTTGNLINVMANTGQLLRQTVCEGNSQQVDVASLTPGMYFVQVMDGNKMLYTVKFVKQ